MFLLFPCLGTILAPSCQPSCQRSSSPPPSSWSVVAVSSHLSSRSMTAPTPFCAADPAPSPSGLGPKTRSSPSDTSRPVWPRAVLPQPSGSCFQTRWFLRVLLRRHPEMALEPFSYPVRRFLHAQDQRHLHGLHKRGTHIVNGHCHRG
jgi:hypothetical protein